MGERKISPLYRLIKAAVRAVYPKIKVVGEENLPPEPVVYVGNHSQMNGPIACELYTPGEHYIWCAGEMMDKKEVPGQRQLFRSLSRLNDFGMDTNFV